MKIRKSGVGIKITRTPQKQYSCYWWRRRGSLGALPCADTHADFPTVHRTLGILLCRTVLFDPLLKKQHEHCKSSIRVTGGDEEDRTLDLTDANRTLSQLSYAPICLLCDYKIFFAVCQVFGGGLEKFFFAAPVFMPSACRHRPSFRAWSIPRARRESALSCCCCCRRQDILCRIS